MNWQSVIYAGYGDDRELTGETLITGRSTMNRLAPLDRQFFVKLSHAFQR